MKIKAKRRLNEKPPSSKFRPFNNRIATELDYGQQPKMNTLDIPLGSMDPQHVSDHVQGDHDSSQISSDDTQHFAESKAVNMHSITSALNEWRLMNEAAKRIQNFYFRKKYNDYIFRATQMNSLSNAPTESWDTEYVQPLSCPIDTHGNIPGDEQKNVDETNLSHYQDNITSEQVEESVQQSTSAMHHCDAEIEVPWTKPSWSLAKKYEAETHPRKAGGKKYFPEKTHFERIQGTGNASLRTFHDYLGVFRDQSS